MNVVWVKKSVWEVPHIHVKAIEWVGILHLVAMDVKVGVV
jgi:hypothetical protein